MITVKVKPNIQCLRERGDFDYQNYRYQITKPLPTLYCFHAMAEHPTPFLYSYPVNITFACGLLGTQTFHA